MPNPTTKNRQAIKNRFVRNAIPTQADFADLIDASLNQADDGLLKLPNEPLGLVLQQPDKPVLRFYDSPDATGSAWQIQLSADNNAGFALANADKDGAITTRLFLDALTGNVGIGTIKADAKLTVQGGMQISDNVSIGGRVDMLSASNPIRFSSTWSGFPDDKANGAEISNDVANYKTLMIVGNKSAGGPRSVSIWDVLNVNGSLKVAFTATTDKLVVNSALTATGTTSLAALITSGNIAFSTDTFCLNSINKNVGIGTIASNDFKLDVSGSVRLGGFTIGDSFEWPKLVWLRDIPNNWDEGLIKHASNQGFFRRQGFGIHLHESRDFHLFSSGMNALFGVEGGSGNTSIKGNLTVRGSGVKDPDSGMSGVGQLAIKGTSPQIDFIDADHNDWSIHVNSNKMYFIRQPWEFKDLVLDGAGNVGIGTDAPAAKLQITGNVSITSAEGQNIACKNNYMAPGSLTIGGIDRNYGGGNNWNSSTAGLLLEALDNTEIAIHDSGVRLASFMYYEGAKNQFTIGRDMGWGAISAVNVQGSLQVNGQTNILTGSNPIRFSSNWTAFPDDKSNGAEICNDISAHKTLMIVGNRSNGGGRRVSIWDSLEVNGTCIANGSFQVNNNGNTFKIDTLADRAIFTLSKAFFGPGRQISWDGDNNWDQYSDETLKTNINIETGILPRLLRIDVKSFQWKDELESNKKQLGFIAQDVRLAFPDLVKEKPFGEQRLMSLNYANFGILAVGAIKELNAIMAAEIQELRVELDLLKQQVGN